RFSIDQYYRDHLEFDLSLLLDTLKIEQRDMMEKVILNDTLWLKKTQFNDEDINVYLHVVLEANDKRRLAEINSKLQNLDDYKDALLQDKIALIQERDAIKMRLQNKNKEE
ncbi:MAG: hypothetical protein RBQ71_06805, partial [Acholeplasmataceae bacterium]|nr:hypothetical protein [Acholeplasmataceae bacterium]